MRRVLVVFGVLLILKASSVNAQDDCIGMGRSNIKDLKAVITKVEIDAAYLRCDYNGVLVDCARFKELKENRPKDRTLDPNMRMP